MPDLPIVIPDTAVAPKDYTLSGTQELALKTVRALIDGSGAASAFLPTLQLLDPNGHVMWEGATSSTVAAGGSADVSWFPGIGRTTTAAATGTGWTFAEMSAPAIVTVPAGTTKIVDMSSVNIYTNDATTFAIGSKVIGGTTYHGIKCIKDGHYLAKGQAAIVGFQTAAAGYLNAYWRSQPGNPASYGSGGEFLNTPVAVANGQWDPYIEGLTTVSGGSSDIWVMEVNNATAVDVTAYLDMIAVQLDTDTTHIF